MTNGSEKRPNLDSVTTINQDGSHYKLHPADVRGFFTRWRRSFGLILLVVYVLLPWLPVNGFPAVFFDLAERRFHLFGLTFLVEDFWLAFFAISGVGFSLFYVTSLFGRLWCGWACPYTVFLDHVFRRIERFVDGDAPARRRLDAAAWSAEKVRKRVLKHGLYLFAAALIAHVFLSYFVSLPRLYQYMQESPFAHLQSFAMVLFLTVALYFCFSWFREQFCIILCPYGRIQSALTDDETVVIGYDSKRGEPRGRATLDDVGDCVDCKRCVKVCPTGIDIRNGLQMECIGCAACIDACDEVMGKLGRAKGLVRYDSLNGLAGLKTRFIRPRTILYTVLMLCGAVAASVAVTKVHDVDFSLMRMRGNPYYLDDVGVRNQFEVRVATKRNTSTVFHLSIIDKPEWLELGGFEKALTVGPQGEARHPIFVTIPKSHYTGPLTLSIQSESEPGGTKIIREFRLLGPAPYVLREEEKEDAK